MLSKKAAKRIANLINQIYVAQYMLNSGTQENNKKLWYDSMDQATLALFSEFGIALPGLKLIQERKAA